MEPDQRIGQVVARYRVDCLIGDGGMGRVYLGIHEVLESKVAIKFLRSDLSQDSEIVERFVNEAKAATRINHSGIIKVYDFGNFEGSAFCVMEFLEGETLSSRLERCGALSSQEIARIGSQMADALGAAHAAGIVHRDLKPDNVFLVPDRQIPGGERVKILDFGIAKLASAELKASFKTRPGMMMGTPHYMSPEQIRGAGGVDGRADIYSLGCMLFQMACGQVPFGGDSLGSILGAHEHVAPPSPRTLNPNVPPPAETFLLQTLAKRPQDRPQTMQDVTTGLSAFGRTSMEIAASSAHPTTLSSGAGQVSYPGTGQVDPVPKKSPVGWIIGGIVAFGASAAVAFLVWKSSQSSDVDEPVANNDPPGEIDEKTSGSSPPPPAPADDDSAIEAAEPAPFPHRWVLVTPPDEPIMLGVSARAGHAGFSPAKKIMSPAAAFEIHQHEVTWREFGPWLDKNRKSHQVRSPSWLPSDSKRRDLFPVTGVAWPTADAYCRSLGDGSRLPTDEEWELAARGASKRPYSWGDSPPDPERTRIFAGESAPLVEVMSMEQDKTPVPKPESARDQPVFDLIGNAFEWVDGYGRDDGPADDSWAHTGAVKFRSYRGLPPAGAASGAIPAEGAAYRGNLCETGTCDKQATLRLEYMGFRCVRAPKDPTD